ncbi:Hypothetical protein CINCED_3A006883 [Cinara cedri]|uniref:Uncharacterized protein n=1 Tax=Cinara cedri TaxID=506608 RepID=A0A5E4NLN9_9HEMI|nr:Hypothetical protein CINCED_3A006883 [Cinara cedri]
MQVTYVIDISFAYILLLCVLVTILYCNKEFACSFSHRISVFSCTEVKDLNDQCLCNM